MHHNVQNYADINDTLTDFEQILNAIESSNANQNNKNNDDDKCKNTVMIDNISCQCMEMVLNVYY